MFVKEAKSLSEFVAAVDEFWTLNPGSVPDWVWYRGVSNFLEFKLVPSFFRNIISTNDPSLIDEKERIIVREFLYKYELYDTNHFGYTSRADPAVVFGKMQHYGVSSRLLDFSYSAFVALYMAVGVWDKWKDNGHIAHPMNDGAVWLLNAPLANQTLGRKDVIESFEHCQEYLPAKFRAPGVPLPQRPVAIEAPLSNQRIIAQQGCFVCFGSDPTPLDEQLSQCPDCIGVIKIAAARKEEMYEQLERVGVTDDVLFQDLQTLGNRLHRHYGA